MWPKDLAKKLPAEEYQARRIAQVEKRLSEPDGMFFKAVDADRPNVIVGYTGWFGPGHFSKKSTTSEEQQLPAGLEAHDVVEAGPTPANSEPPPAWINAEAFAEFNRKMEEARNEVWSGDCNYWCQWRLAVRMHLELNSCRFGITWCRSCTPAQRPCETDAPDRTRLCRSRPAAHLSGGNTRWSPNVQAIRLCGVRRVLHC